MDLISTAGRAPRTSFSEALFRSMAEDGGLFMPEGLPAWPEAFWESLRGRAISEIGAVVMGRLLGDEISSELVAEVMTDALDFEVPLTGLDQQLSILELFHGPTLAFKDVGARFMARMMAALSSSEEGELTVLVATSGDTGSAVAQAFLGLRGTRIVVLFPDGQVSALQERQFTTLGENVCALAVDGTFDDCQRLAKQAFADDELKRAVRLTSANSINIGRLLPQMLYYISAWANLDAKLDDGELVFCTPSGNFGNLTAGLMAHRLGLPVAGFVAATNVNDVVPEYLETGVFSPRPSVRTISNAMDVGDPSNLARIMHLYNNDVDAIRKDVHGFSFTDAETQAAIADVDDQYGRVLDPHTAVGYLGLRREMERRSTACRGILLATAHPAKFADIVNPVIGRELALPRRLAACLERDRVATPMAAEYSALRTVLLD